MKLDFIEIGTSDFRTLAFDPTKTGIIVEPVKVYLDNIPNREGLVKIHAAIVNDPNIDSVTVYYNDPKVIEAHNLPQWVRGFNSVSNPHPTITKMFGNIKDLVKTDQVNAVTLDELLDEVTEVNLLKIDTEGMDVYIMQRFFEMETRPKVNEIQFESNSLNDLNILTHVKALALINGYTVEDRVVRGTNETVLKLKA